MKYEGEQGVKTSIPRKLPFVSLFWLLQLFFLFCSHLFCLSPSFSFFFYLLYFLSCYISLLSILLSSSFPRFSLLSLFEKQSPALYFFLQPYTHLLEFFFIANSSLYTWGVFLSPNSILSTRKVIFLNLKNESMHIM